MEDPTDVALIESRAEDAKVRDLTARQTEIGDLMWVLSNKRGRRFIWRLLEQAGVFRMSFTPGAPDVSAFNEGQRNGGLRVLAQIQENAPESYALMLSEANARNHD